MSTDNAPVAAAAGAKSRARRGLPFTFAQHHGVLLDEAEDGSVCVVHKGELQLQVLTELRRVLGRPFTLAALSGDEFKRRLTLAYQRTDNDSNLQNYAYSNNAVWMSLTWRL